MASTPCPPRDRLFLMFQKRLPAAETDTLMSHAVTCPTCQQTLEEMTAGAGESRGRPGPTNEAAWSEFVRLYGARIRAWCRDWGLQEADAEDVTQQVLLELAEQMRTFAYDPSLSFRAWLKTVARNTMSDWVCDQERLGQVNGAEVLCLLEQVPAREDLAQRLEEQYDHELLEEASSRVRLRVEPHTWEAFWLTALEGLTGAEAARRTGLTLTHVYVARHRVETMLRDEVRKLDC